MSFHEQSGTLLTDQASQARPSGAAPADGAPAAPFLSGGGPVTPRQSFPAQPGQSAGLLRASRTTGTVATGAAPTQIPAGALAAAPTPAKTIPGRRPGLGRTSRFWRGNRERGPARPAVQSPPPLSGRARFVLQLVMLLVFLGAIWFISGMAGNGQPGAAGSSSSRGQPGASAPTAAPGKTGPLSAEQVTATFLQNFFSWDGAESDQSYITGWAKFVAPNVVATIDTAAPRQVMDNGNDSMAQSPVPAIPAGSAQMQGQSAQVQAAWTIQVVPPSSEKLIWQTRQIQATVWLTQSGTTWLVTNLTWQSSGS